MHGQTETPERTGYFAVAAIGQKASGFLLA